MGTETGGAVIRMLSHSAGPGWLAFGSNAAARFGLAVAHCVPPTRIIPGIMMAPQNRARFLQLPAYAEKKILAAFDIAATRTPGEPDSSCFAATPTLKMWDKPSGDLPRQITAAGHVTGGGSVSHPQPRRPTCGMLHATTACGQPGSPLRCIPAGLQGASQQGSRLDKDPDLHDKKSSNQDAEKVLRAVESLRPSLLANCADISLGTKENFWAEKDDITV
ncbi:hypothetical protein C8R46DRAFT_1042773 [Mycena filopes]|nr:hypothetical protein C8R46DRAFT_1042773 [Mycena filopes]